MATSFNPLLVAHPPFSSTFDSTQIQNHTSPSSASSSNNTTNGTSPDDSSPSSNYYPNTDPNINNISSNSNSNSSSSINRNINNNNNNNFQTNNPSFWDFAGSNSSPSPNSLTSFYVGSAGSVVNGSGGGGSIGTGSAPPSHPNSANALTPSFSLTGGYPPYGGGGGRGGSYPNSLVAGGSSHSNPNSLPGSANSFVQSFNFDDRMSTMNGSDGMGSGGEGINGHGMEGSSSYQGSMPNSADSFRNSFGFDPGSGGGGGGGDGFGTLDEWLNAGGGGVGVGPPSIPPAAGGGPILNNSFHHNDECSIPSQPSSGPPNRTEFDWSSFFATATGTGINPNANNPLDEPTSGIKNPTNNRGSNPTSNHPHPLASSSTSYSSSSPPDAGVPPSLSSLTSSSSSSPNGSSPSSGASPPGQTRTQQSQSRSHNSGQPQGQHGQFLSLPMGWSVATTAATSSSAGNTATTASVSGNSNGINMIGPSISRPLTGNPNPIPSGSGINFRGVDGNHNDNTNKNGNKKDGEEEFDEFVDSIPQPLRSQRQQPQSISQPQIHPQSQSQSQSHQQAQQISQLSQFSNPQQQQLKSLPPKMQQQLYEFQQFQKFQKFQQYLETFPDDHEREMVIKGLGMGLIGGGGYGGINDGNGNGGGGSSRGLQIEGGAGDDDDEDDTGQGMKAISGKGREYLSTDVGEGNGIEERKTKRARMVGPNGNSDSDRGGGEQIMMNVDDGERDGNEEVARRYSHFQSQPSSGLRSSSSGNHQNPPSTASSGSSGLSPPSGSGGQQHLIGLTSAKPPSSTSSSSNSNNSSHNTPTTPAIQIQQAPPTQTTTTGNEFASYLGAGGGGGQSQISGISGGLKRKSFGEDDRGGSFGGVGIGGGGGYRPSSHSISMGPLPPAPPSGITTPGLLPSGLAMAGNNMGIGGSNNNNGGGGGGGGNGMGGGMGLGMGMGMGMGLGMGMSSGGGGGGMFGGGGSGINFPLSGGTVQLPPQPQSRTGGIGGIGGGGVGSLGGHNAVERRYRNNINAHIARLRDIVPALRHLKPPSQGGGGGGGLGAGSGVTGGPAGLSSSGRRTSQFTLTTANIGEIPTGLVDGVKAAKKLSKGTILGKAIEYIEFLSEVREELKSDLDDLKETVRINGGGKLISVWEERMELREQERLRLREERAKVNTNNKGKGNAAGGSNAMQEDDSEEDDDDDEIMPSMSTGGKKTKTAPGSKKTSSNATAGTKRAAESGNKDDRPTKRKSSGNNNVPSRSSKIPSGGVPPTSSTPLSTITNPNELFRPVLHSGGIPATASSIPSSSTTMSEGLQSYMQQVYAAGGGTVPGGMSIQMSSAGYNPFAPPPPSHHHTQHHPNFIYTSFPTSDSDQQQQQQHGGPPRTLLAVFMGVSFAGGLGYDWNNRRGGSEDGGSNGDGSESDSTPGKAWGPTTGRGFQPPPAADNLNQQQQILLGTTTTHSNSPLITGLAFLGSASILAWIVFLLFPVYKSWKSKSSSQGYGYTSKSNVGRERREKAVKEIEVALGRVGDLAASAAVGTNSPTNFEDMIDHPSSNPSSPSSLTMEESEDCALTLRSGLSKFVNAPKNKIEMIFWILVDLLGMGIFSIIGKLKWIDLGFGFGFGVGKGFETRDDERVGEALAWVRIAEIDSIVDFKAVPFLSRLSAFYRLQYLSSSSAWPSLASEFQTPFLTQPYVLALAALQLQSAYPPDAALSNRALSLWKAAASASTTRSNGAEESSPSGSKFGKQRRSDGGNDSALVQRTEPWLSVVLSLDFPTACQLLDGLKAPSSSHPSAIARTLPDRSPLLRLAESRARTLLARTWAKMFVEVMLQQQSPEQQQQQQQQQFSNRRSSSSLYSGMMMNMSPGRKSSGRRGSRSTGTTTTINDLDLALPTPESANEIDNNLATITDAVLSSADDGGSSSSAEVKALASVTNALWAVWMGRLGWEQIRKMIGVTATTAPVTLRKSSTTGDGQESEEEEEYDGSDPESIDSTTTIDCPDDSIAVKMFSALAKDDFSAFADVVDSLGIEREKEWMEQQGGQYFDEEITEKGWKRTETIARATIGFLAVRKRSLNGPPSPSTTTHHQRITEESHQSLEPATAADGNDFPSPSLSQDSSMRSRHSSLLASSRSVSASSESSASSSGSLSWAATVSQRSKEQHNRVGSGYTQRSSSSMDHLLQKVALELRFTFGTNVWKFDDSYDVEGEELLKWSTVRRRKMYDAATSSFGMEERGSGGEEWEVYDLLDAREDCVDGLSVIGRRAAGFGST